MSYFVTHKNDKTAGNGPLKGIRKMIWCVFEIKMKVKH